MATTIAIPTVELVSVIHTAPANGAPSSADYYDGESQKITDLSTITLFINNTLLPILNSLPLAAANGILGTTCFTDIANQDALVYNSLTSTPLTITQSMRLLNGQLQTSNTTITNLSQQVASLQSRLSASSQDDLSLALQNITGSLATVTSQVQSLNTTVGSIQALVGTEQDAVVSTGSIAINGAASVSITWGTPFTDNTYSVSYSLEDASGFLFIRGFYYNSSGTGVTINVHNTDTAAAHTGNIHVTGRANSAT